MAIIRRGPAIPGATKLPMPPGVVKTADGRFTLTAAYPRMTVVIRPSKKSSIAATRKATKSSAISAARKARKSSVKRNSGAKASLPRLTIITRSAAAKRWSKTKAPLPPLSMITRSAAKKAAARQRVVLTLKVPKPQEPPSRPPTGLVSPLGCVPIPDELEPFPDFDESMADLAALEEAEAAARREAEARVAPRRLRLVCRPPGESGSSGSSDGGSKGKKRSHEESEVGDESKEVGGQEKRPKIVLRLRVGDKVTHLRE
ncbi:MAG: hypothetical protein LQ340_000651 [Diploschistes diacapsis]|nr:MAG: hypothetical protein LQ340_000651 [Diploschistes diacapsis]